MKRYFLIFTLVFLGSRIFSQDTLTVMHYNLLYYGEVTGFCNNSNNSLEMKDPHLRTILNYVKPDIFTVNEISQNEAIHQHMLDNNLNINFANYFKRAASSNTANSNIVNMLYYDSRKLRLKKQYTAQNYVRDVDVYELYYNSNDLAQGDTAFIVCVVAHLKAGNTSGDANARKIMAENTLRFLETRFSTENVLFMGDFNYYTGTEPGFQIMLNYANANMRFLDPIGQSGEWNNNSFYAGIHTQSTQSSSTGCKAGGGMDDRFDFILISDEVRFGTNNVRYVQESYNAVGQDGLRFNGSINGPPQNMAVSQQIADALFNVSDHLPIALKLRVDKLLDVNENTSRPFLAEVLPNPAADFARINFHLPSAGNVVFELIDLSGRVIQQSEDFFGIGKHQQNMAVDGLIPGFYFIRITDQNNRIETLKMLKK
jgi:endonuclease/exonuclease/phosphatase family metal-dependent hydrolase